MFKQTKIFVEDDTYFIYLPFSNSNDFVSSLGYSIPQFFYSPSYYYPFGKYVGETYGAREDDAKNMWDMYKRRVLSLIENETPYSASDLY